MWQRSDFGRSAAAALLVALAANPVVAQTADDDRAAATRSISASCQRFAAVKEGAVTNDDATALLAALLQNPDAPTLITGVAKVAAERDLPGYCRVQGTIEPQIRFELRLPLEGWNGKLLMQGCGGMCGLINMAATEDSLIRGYAVVNTDMGHEGTPDNALWALNNRSAELDFAYRSTWATARLAQRLVRIFYRVAPARSYFNGCSTGGRQGMLAAQRFPELFDGIIAGAPVLNQTGNAMLHLAWLARANVGDHGRQILSRATIARVHAHVMAACDLDDGVADGMLADPQACAWRPEQMACRDGVAADDCLTPEEIATLHKFYAGAANASGNLRWASGGGVAAGSEPGWSPVFVGEGDVPGLLYSTSGMLDQILQAKLFYIDPGLESGLTIRDFDFDDDVERLALTEFFYNAQNPDLRRFQARGGKLILWHGWNDIEVPPGFSTDYYELAMRTMGGAQATGEFFRLFMLPGVEHCRRGSGADAIDFLTALEQWVEEDIAPDAVMAHKLVTEQSYLGLPRPRFPLADSDWHWRRPVFAYPEVAVFSGEGDWKDPAKWRPRTQAVVQSDAKRADAKPMYRPDVRSRYSDADDALYRQRLDWRARELRDFDSYDTTEPVTGATTWQALPTASAGQHTLAADALAAARAYAEAQSSSSLLVWRRGQVELKAYFEDRAETDTVLARSLAKPLAAVAVGRAIALGHIRSLDQPAADFFPAWRDDALRSRVRIRHLLDMTSGFPPQGFSVDAEDLLNLAFLHPRHDEIIERDMPVVREPGTHFAYNNAQFELIALLIARATGQPYHVFLGRELFARIGAAGGEIWVNRPGGTAHAGCCLMVPPESWLRIGVLLVQDGVWEGQQLLPQGYAGQMATGTRANPYYGLGVYVAGEYVQRRGWAGPERTPVAMQVLHSEPYLAGDLYLFDGNGHQVLYVIPSEQLVILRTGGAPQSGREWDNAVLPNTLLRGIRHAQGTSTVQPRQGAATADPR